MTQQMLDKLDKFFADIVIADVDRNSFRVCALEDKVNKLTICLVFMRDWHGLDTDSYNSVVIEGNGVVFTIPAYWTCVPKELAMPYLISIIEDYYRQEGIVSGIGSGGSSTDANTGNGSTGGGNCCNPQCPAVNNSVTVVANNI